MCEEKKMLKQQINSNCLKCLLIVCAAFFRHKLYPVASEISTIETPCRFQSYFCGYIISSLGVISCNQHHEAVST